MQALYLRFCHVGFDAAFFFHEAVMSICSLSSCICYLALSSVSSEQTKEIEE